MSNRTLIFVGSDQRRQRNIILARLNPGEVIVFTREDFERLKQMISPPAAFSENAITANASLIQKRMLISISASAEEKYIDVIETYPSIFHRIPLHMIAS